MPLDISFQPSRMSLRLRAKGSIRFRKNYKASMATTKGCFTSERDGPLACSQWEGNQTSMMLRC